MVNFENLFVYVRLCSPTGWTEPLELTAALAAFSEYTWLDRGDLILEALMDLIEEEMDADTDSLSKERLFEKVQTRGIDESTARFSLDQLGTTEK
jgi:hypothetical protein